VLGKVSCCGEDTVYGNNPRKLFVRIIRNSEVRINEFPLFSFPFLKFSAQPCGAPTPQTCKKIKRQFCAPRVKAAAYKLCGYRDFFCSQKTMYLTWTSGNQSMLAG
jgi:hypothetical protein